MGPGVAQPGPHCTKLAPLLLLLLLSCLHQVAGQAQVAGADGKVDCASLTEFQGISNLPPIYGRCKPSSSAKALSSQSVSGALSAQSMDSERWITVWKESSADNTSSSSNQPQGDLTATACAEAAAAGSRFSATCIHVYASALSGFTASFSRSQLAAFLQAYAPLVDLVSLDSKVSIQQTTTGIVESTAATGSGTSGLWGLDRIDQQDLPLDGKYHYFNTGTGVHAYIIDTGILATHQEFKYADGTSGSRANEVFTTLTTGTPGDDCEGHGTHVAGSVGGLTYGVAKNVTLHAVRILDCAGDGSVSDVVAALDWLVVNAQRPAVATMSLGGDINPALDAAVQSATNAGIHVVVAAGNDDRDACQVSPARTPSALTVGATDPQDHRLWLATGTASNYGSCVDLFAPGRDILSASPKGDATTKGTETETRTGTSQAVPFVAGVAALILQNRSSIDPASMSSLLASSAAQGKLGEVTGSGFLTLDASNTPNKLLQSIIPSPLTVKPTEMELSSALATYLSFTISLSQQPQARVALSVRVPWGSISPTGAFFSPTNWTTPQTVVYSPDPLISSSGNIDISVTTSSADLTFDNLQATVGVVDSKGDLLSYPKVIPMLPYSDEDNTTLYHNDYMIVCAGAAPGTSKDVAYYFKPQVACTVTFSLCGSSALPTTYDTRLFVLQNVDDGGSLDLMGCDSNSCGSGSTLSKITVNLRAGVGYGFIVDGVGGASGPYRLSVTAAEGTVAGDLPPASLLTSKTRVVGSTTQNTTTNSSIVNIPGTSLYWAVGAWSDTCNSNCQQTRVVACYSAVADGSGGGAAAQESACLAAGEAKPDTTRACDTTCSPSTRSVLNRYMPIIAGVGGGMAAALVLAGLLLCYVKHRRTKRQPQGEVEKQQQFMGGTDATITVRGGRRGSSTGGSRLGSAKASGGLASPVAEPLPTAQYVTVHAADYVLPQMDSPHPHGGGSQQPTLQQAALAPADQAVAARPPLPALPLHKQQHVVEVAGSPSFGQLLRQRSPRKSGTGEAGGSPFIS